MIDRLAYAFLLVLLVATPWPVGSRLPWVSMLVAAAAITVWAVRLLEALTRGRKLVFNPLLPPILALLAWTGFQWAADLTIYPHASAYEWVRYLSYAAVFDLTLQVAHTGRRARRLVRVIAWMAIAVGLFGLLQFLTWNGHLYWIYDPPYGGTRFGPFNNRNYFAGYMVAALGPALGLLFSRRAVANRVLFGYLTWIAVLAVLVSLSRGGALALAAVLGTTVVLGPARPQTRDWKVSDSDRRAKDPRRLPAGKRPQETKIGLQKLPADGAAAEGLKLRTPAVLAAVVVLALLAGLFWLQQTDRVLGSLETILHFESEASFQSRLYIWRDAMSMVKERPWLGFGLNTFGWAFPRYQREPSSLVATHAHNEYVEMLVETGIIGAAICLWFVIVLLVLSWQRLRTAGGTDRACRLGALAGWLGILVYSFTDFPTIIPAINYLLAVLAAVATMKLAQRGPGGRQASAIRGT